MKADPLNVSLVLLLASVQNNYPKFSDMYTQLHSVKQLINKFKNSLKTKYYVLLLIWHISDDSSEKDVITEVC